MALVFKDRVRVTSTTTGTGTFTLGSAVSGFQDFSVIGNGNTTYYTIADQVGNWEVGIGTYTSSGTTLSRDTVLESSNSNSIVNFPSGSKTVFVTYPANKAVFLDASGNLNQDITGVASNVTGTVGISNGGTNQTSFTAPSGNVKGAIYFDGTSFANDATVTDFGYNTVTNTATFKNVAFSGTQVASGGSYQEMKVAIAASNIDMALGNYFTKTISGATSLTVSNVPATGTAMSFILDLTNGGSATITWWSGMKWAGGTAPTLTASGRDVLGFFTHDGGTKWTGLVLGKDVK